MVCFKLSLLLVSFVLSPTVFYLLFVCIVGPLNMYQQLIVETGTQI